MATNLDKQSPEWRQGEFGEEIVRQWAIRQGYAVIDISRIDTGGAPMAEALFFKEILPDFQLMARGATTWLEIKTKTKYTPYRKQYHRPQTGIAVNHWIAYQRIQKLSNIRCLIAFLQIDLDAIFVAAIDQLFIDHECHDLSRVEYPTVYFNLDNFDEFKLSGNDLVMVRKWKLLIDSTNEEVTPSKNNGPRDVRRGDRWLPWHIEKFGPATR